MVVIVILGIFVLLFFLVRYKGKKNLEANIAAEQQDVFEEMASFQNTIDYHGTTYQYRKDVERYSRCVSMCEIKNNDYNLNIPRYVDTFEQEEEISLSDIASELQEQDKEIKAAQDELLSQFAELTASDEQAQAEIAELMKTLEGLF